MSHLHSFSPTKVAPSVARSRSAFLIFFIPSNLIAKKITTIIVIIICTYIISVERYPGRLFLIVYHLYLDNNKIVNRWIIDELWMYHMNKFILMNFVGTRQDFISWQISNANIEKLSITSACDKYTRVRLKIKMFFYKNILLFVLQMIFSPYLS